MISLSLLILSKADAGKCPHRWHLYGELQHMRLNQQVTCEVDFVRSNMDVYVEEVLLLDDVPASSRAADLLQEADLVCCATIMYLRIQGKCDFKYAALEITSFSCTHHASAYLEERRS